MAERGEYRPIYIVITDTPEFQALSPMARLLWYTLKMRLGPSGIDVAYDEPLSEQSGIPTVEIDQYRDELVEGGWLAVQHRVHWLRNGLRYEPNLSLAHDNHRKGVAKHLSGLPRLAIVERFATYYGVDAPFAGAPSEGIRMGFAWDPKGSEFSTPTVENVGQNGRKQGIGKGSPGDRQGIGKGSPAGNGIREREREQEPEREEASKEVVEADGVRALAEAFPDAAAALGTMEHPGGRDATEATLRMRFLYPDGQGDPDPAVRGLPLDRRLQLVASGLLEMRDQGRAWSRPVLGGFIRRSRATPDPTTEAAQHTGATEAEREELRRTKAAVRRRDDSAREDLEREGAARLDGMADAKAWLQEQPKDVQASVAVQLRANLRRLGFRGDPDRAPPVLAADALLQAVQAARDRAGVTT